jgi:hypothetical protein
MSGAQIAREIAAALREVARDVGDGEFIAYLIRPASTPSEPWGGSPAEPVTYNLPVIDSGMKLRTEAGTLIARRAHIITVPALGLVPLTSDKLNFRNREYAILSVETVAPAGVDIYYEIEVDGGRAVTSVPGIDPPELIAPPEGQDW